LANVYTFRIGLMPGTGIYPHEIASVEAKKQIAG